MLQVVRALLRVSGSHLEPVVRERRAGDAAAVVAVVNRIRERTGWTARYGIDDIVRSAWDARAGR